MSKKDRYELRLVNGLFNIVRNDVPQKGFATYQEVMNWSMEHNISFIKFPIVELLNRNNEVGKGYVEIWMYKAAKGGLFSWLISMQEKIDKHDFAKGLYSHVEVCFPTLGVCWSSSEVDGGTRFKFIKRDNKKWDAFMQPVKDIVKIAQTCEDITPAAYDWLAIAHFLIRWIKDSLKRFVCSEGVHHVMMSDGTWPALSYIPAPGDIYDCFFSDIKV